MGYSYILSSEAFLASFWAAYNVPENVNIAYCHEGISTSKGVVVAILEGGVRFPVDPLNISTLRFYSLCPDQLPPNFY